MAAFIIAKRYAKALADLAREQGLLEEVYNDMLFLRQCARENRELVAVLNSPGIPSDKKESVAQALFSDHINKLTLGFLKLVLKHNREFYFKELLHEFTLQYKAAKNIHTIEVTTAVAMEEDTRAALLAKLSTLQDGNIELDEKVDENIIGGMILRMNDLQYDASVLNKLKKIKKSFSSHLHTNKL